MGAAAASVAALLVGAGPAQAAAAPTLTVDRACPGTATLIHGTGFADGPYDLHTTAGTLTSTTAVAKSGVLTPTPRLVLPADAPQSFTISATPHAGGPSGSSFTAALSAPNITRESGWPTTALGERGDCFRPGERVTVSYSPGVSGPAAVLAGPSGLISITFTLHPQLQPIDVAATLTGSSSHQVGSAVLYPLPGTTLLAGQSVSDNGDANELTSPSGSYVLFPVSGLLILERIDGSEAPLWVVGGDPASQRGSTLTLQQDGNLVFRSGAGKLLWAAGTTGAGSEIRLQDNGNLVMTDSSGKPIWSSRAGVIFVANRLRGYAYAASSRPLVRLAPPSTPPGQPVSAVPPRFAPGPAVYINGLIKQATPAGELIRSGHRVAYLQRFLAGRWQNMLSRTTDSAGLLAVGFVQTRPIVYRLVVPATTMTAATASSPFIR